MSKIYSTSENNALNLLAGKPNDGGAAETVGIGLKFVTTDVGEHFVTSLVPNGAAAMSGLVSPVSREGGDLRTRWAASRGAGGKGGHWGKGEKAAGGHKKVQMKRSAD